jgi:hypothetical protein
VKTKDHHFTNANCELFYFKFSSYIFKLKINLGIFGPKKSQMNDICFKLLSTVIVISKCSWNTSYDEKWKQLKTLALDQNYLKWPFVMIVRFFIWIEKSFLIEKNIFSKSHLNIWSQSRCYVRQFFLRQFILIYFDSFLIFFD